MLHTLSLFLLYYPINILLLYIASGIASKRTWLIPAKIMLPIILADLLLIQLPITNPLKNVIILLLSNVLLAILLIKYFYKLNWRGTLNIWLIWFAMWFVTKKILIQLLVIVTLKLPINATEFLAHI